MASARPSTGLLARVLAAGVTGLPAVELDLGPLTALVGPRGSGRSQLLAAIAWLVTGRPRIIPAVGAPVTRVAGELVVDGQVAGVARSPGAGFVWEPPRPQRPALPGCSFLRARDRLNPPPGATGEVGQRLAGMADLATSDATAAEALVSVVETCCREQLTGEILLVEEPELFLTPQAQRYLYRLMRRFAEGGNQVMYSTRSPAFVDAAHHDEIVRLDLHGGRSLRRTDPETLTDAERVRLAAQFDHERSEMFFAQAVVLVEGQTERLSLPFIFGALGHDPDAEGIAIVEVGGKSNLPLAARLLRQLEIPFVIVFDADRGAASAALDAEIHLSAGKAPVFRLEPDFEAAAGIVSHDDKVLHAWRRFATATAVEVPPALARIVGAVPGLRASDDGPPVA